MFCPNCGKKCPNLNFCPYCGYALAERTENLKLSDENVIVINGKSVDIHKVIRMYGNGMRKSGAYAYLVAEHGVTRKEAKEILDPLYEKFANEKISFADGLSANWALENQKITERNNKEKERIAAVKESGAVYCPKCYSTSISANKKGFSFVRGAVGMAVGLDVGLIAGGIGSRKVVCTCLKCGHKWKPGKIKN